MRKKMRGDIREVWEVGKGEIIIRIINDLEQFTLQIEMGRVGK